jgi:two-component system KDP operon response regulator KdpE
VRILVTDAELAHRLEGALPAQHAIELVASHDLPARLARGGCDLLVADGGEAPQVSGLRAGWPLLPILVVTPADDLAARVAALEAGADDALAEPWAPSQMAARVGALGRRAALSPRDVERLEADGCLLELGAGRAIRDGHEVKLSGREVAILRWLLRHPGRAVSREELLQHVFGVAPGVQTRSVDVAMATLRKKIERDPTVPALIVTVRGLGYGWGPNLT